MSTSRQIFLPSHCVEKHMPWVLWPTKKLNSESIQNRQCNVATWNPTMIYRGMFSSKQAPSGRYSMRHTLWRIFCAPVILEERDMSMDSENHSNEDEDTPEATSENALAQPLNSDELKSLLADSERAKLIKKLSEANQHNRFLKRQLYVKEDALVDFKSELAIMEQDIQALVNLAEEIANLGIPESSRKINGKYIQSHLLSRLKAVHEKLKQQTKDVDAAQSKEVTLFWCGMAESVQVMGSFDGWSQGEHFSPEYTGSYTKFSTTFMLTPGRYEIKFLIDGEWHLSPEYPTVGEGLMKNNLLIVE